MKMDTTQNGPWGVIFDMDGVLINSYDAHLKAWHQVLPKHGLQMTEEVFVKTINKIGLPPEKCIVIEDAPAGVKAAKAAGCDVIAVTGSVSREQLGEADLIVDSLRDLNPAKCRELMGLTSRKFYN